MNNTYKVMMVTLGLTGGVTILILGIAIGLGLWLDSVFALEKNYITFGLIVLSLPLNIASLFWVARYTTGRYVHPAPDGEEAAQDEIKQEDA